jgi:cell wall assembly regulator SMI1
VVDIKEAGRLLSDDDIVSLERRIGCRLPEPYRRFLLRYNGGRPTPDADTIDIEHLPGSPTDVGDFFGIDDPVGSCNIEWNIEALKGRIADHLLPVACDSGGNRFCISLSPNDYGSVVYCDFDPGFGFHVSESVIYYKVAPSFDSFIERIRSLENN